MFRARGPTEELRAATCTWAALLTMLKVMTGDRIIGHFCSLPCSRSTVLRAQIQSSPAGWEVRPGVGPAAVARPRLSYRERSALLQHCIILWDAMFMIVTPDRGLAFPQPRAIISVRRCLLPHHSFVHPNPCDYSGDHCRNDWPASPRHGRLRLRRQLLHHRAAQSRLPRAHDRAVAQAGGRCARHGQGRRRGRRQAIAPIQLPTRSAIVVCSRSHTQCRKHRCKCEGRRLFQSWQPPPRRSVVTVASLMLTTPQRLVGRPAARPERLNPRVPCALGRVLASTSSHGPVAITMKYWPAQPGRTVRAS